MKILLIQTAFIGDVILATATLETLREAFPEAELHFLLRKGNETLLQNHPYIKKTWVWDKKKRKYQKWLQLLKQIREENFSHVINLQRFAATGVLTLLSKAKHKIGFSQNPMAWGYSKKIPHQMKASPPLHEVERNYQLLETTFLLKGIKKPKLYPTKEHIDKVRKYTNNNKEVICIAPSSVWFTKQAPHEFWVELLNQITDQYYIYLLGAPSDIETCSKIIENTDNTNVENLAGELNLLESAALMQYAKMNYVNDSAPMHLASAMNAPTCAIFCSTVPSFGFGPLSNQAFLLEVKEDLPCRPCGNHGKASCPLNHFKCGHHLEVKEALAILEA